MSQINHDGVAGAQDQEDGKQKVVDDNFLFTDDEDVLDTTEENVSSSDEEHNNSTGAARRRPRSTSSPSSCLSSTPRVMSKNREDEEEDEDDDDDDDEQLHLHDLESASSKNFLFPPKDLQDEAEDLQEELDRQRNVNQTVQLHRKKTVNLHTFAEDLQQHEDGILATFVFSDALDQLADEMLLQQEEEPVKNLKSASSDQQEPQPALLRSIATAGWKWLCENFYGSGAAGTRSRSSSAPDEEAPNHLLHDFVLSSEKTRRGLELLFGIVGEEDQEEEQNGSSSSQRQRSGGRRTNRKQMNQVDEQKLLIKEQKFLFHLHKTYHEKYSETQLLEDPVSDSCPPSADVSGLQFETLTDDIDFFLQLRRKNAHLLPSFYNSLEGPRRPGARNKIGTTSEENKNRRLDAERMMQGRDEIVQELESLPVPETSLLEFSYERRKERFQHYKSACYNSALLFNPCLKVIPRGSAGSQMKRPIHQVQCPHVAKFTERQQFKLMREKSLLM
ncbi:unnamed protein product, partial [Amoebophrya sp. A120]|eukprot:GSA120T00000057001.1